MANGLSILAMAAAYVQQSETMPDDLPRFGIRGATPSDIPLLESVERSAAEVFRSVNLGFLVNQPTVDPFVLNGMAAATHLWIAVNDWDQPIGFVGGQNIDGNFHLVGIWVAQGYQGSGVGKALMATMVDQIWREGYKSITLTTYKDVPWNAPWCKKMGFVEVSPRTMGKQYSDILKLEGKRGLDPKSRCLMQKTF